MYSLDQGSSLAGLQMFKDVTNFKVICCGGDGTVGWILETMGTLFRCRRTPSINLWKNFDSMRQTRCSSPIIQPSVSSHWALATTWRVACDGEAVTRANPSTKYYAYELWLLILVTSEFILNELCKNVIKLE